MFIALLLLCFALGAIVIAADQFVEGAATIARRYHLPPLIIGLTLVALGTSAPEIAITIMAAIKQKSAIALGNVIGSNIANIALVMGLMLLVSPIKSHQLDKTKLLFLWAAMLLTLLLFVDLHFSARDGLFLLFLFLSFLVYLYASYQRFNQKRLESITYHQDIIKPYPWLRIVFGLIFLPLTAAMAVSQAVIIAKILGLSDVTIGLTIIAIGTSLPELVTSMTSCFKGHHDIAIGNILGSNIFNLLLVLPFIGLLDPSVIQANIVYRDMPVMLVTSIALLGLTWLSKRLLRLTGFVLLLSYACYIVMLFQT